MMALADLAPSRARPPSAAGVMRRRLADWEGLVESQYARLYNLHLRLTGDSEAAADLTQDTFEQAWRAAEGFRGEARPEVWLYGVALNVGRQWRRRRGWQEPPEPLDQDEPADPEPGAEELTLLRERHDLLLGAVRRLPESWREAVALRYFLGVPAVEIARMEGVDAGTVRWRLHQALKRLWTLLRPTLGKELEEDDAGDQGSLRIAP